MQGFVHVADQVRWQDEQSNWHSGVVVGVTDDGCWTDVMEDGTEDVVQLLTAILEVL